MTFSEQLKALRESKGFSQQQAAWLAYNTPIGTYQGWEQGRHTPAPSMQRSVLEKLEMVSTGRTVDAEAKA